jgi:polysaccharide pyruvyl transferase WcaK-like protein
MLIGAFNSLNKGDQSRVKALVITLKKILPNLKITLLSNQVNIDRIIYKDIPLNVVEKPWSGRFSKIVDGMYNLKKYDMFVEVSGESFTDYYFGKQSFIACFFYICLALILKKNIVLCAQSIGPFKNRAMFFLAKLVLNKVNLITLRETDSLGYLQKCRIGNPHIYLTADPAFLLEPAPYRKINEILSRENIAKDNRPLIGISIGYGSFKKVVFNHENLNKKRHELIEIVAKVIDNLQKELNAIVILIPHVLIPNEDDRIVLERLYKYLKKKHEIKLIYGDYSPEELRGLIGQCDLLITSRFHPLIHAVSMGVPSIAIAYSHKIPSFMRELGLEKYAYMVSDLTFDMLMAGIKDIWKKRESIRKRLKLNIKELQKRAFLNAWLIADLLSTRTIADGER